MLKSCAPLHGRDSNSTEGPLAVQSPSPICRPLRQKGLAWRNCRRWRGRRAPASEAMDLSDASWNPWRETLAAPGATMASHRLRRPSATNADHPLLRTSHATPIPQPACSVGLHHAVGAHSAAESTNGMASTGQTSEDSAPADCGAQRQVRAQRYSAARRRPRWQDDV